MKYGFTALMIILLIFFAISCKSTVGNEQNPIEIKEMNPERGYIEQIASSTGRVVSNLDVEIKCKASGEIISLPFDISDKVSKGDLLVQLDQTEEQRNVRKAEVSLDQSKARLEKARQSYDIAVKDLSTKKRKTEIALDVAKIKAEDTRAKVDRVKQLYQQKLSGYEEYETALTTLANAEAALENAQIQLEDIAIEEKSLELKRQDISLAKADYESSEINLSLAKQRLHDTKVYAPLDSVVTQRDVQIGQIISSGVSTVGGGTTIMTLSDLSRIFILASVDESDIGNVRPEQDVTISADAFPGMKFSGRVERIAQKGNVISNVVIFEVRIEVLSNNKDLLKPEMTANVDIITAKRDDAILVPADALKMVRGKSFVTVLLPDGTQEEIEVEAGIFSGQQVEIVSGLSESDTIIVISGMGPSEWRRNSASPMPRGLR